MVITNLRGGEELRRESINLNCHKTEIPKTNNPSLCQQSDFFGELETVYLVNKTPPLHAVTVDIAT